MLTNTNPPRDFIFIDLVKYILLKYRHTFLKITQLMVNFT